MRIEMKGFGALRRKLYKTYRRLGAFLSRMGLGIIPGAGRLYNLLYNKFIRPKGLVLLNIQGNKMYIDGAGDGVDATLLMHGVYEKYETELFKKPVQDAWVVTVPSTD